jgi:ADP-ribose pyrophosphatase YjhB (NUDIX family)
MSSYLERIRTLVGQDTIPIVFASACICRESGEVLWQRRADFGWWGLPGGIMEAGETLRECIVREVREETGLSVAPIRMIGVYTSPDFEIVYPNGDRVHQVTFCLECRVTGGTLQADFRETIGLAWFSRDERPSPAPWYNAMLDDLMLEQKGAVFDRGGPGMPGSGKPFASYLRERIGDTPFVMPIAVAFITGLHERIMLQKSPDGRTWELPSVPLELGERIDQTLMHGIRRAIGLRIAVQRLIGVYLNDEAVFGLSAVKPLFLLFQCTVNGYVDSKDLPESCTTAIFSPDNLPVVAECHNPLIRDALRDLDGTIF